MNRIIVGISTVAISAALLVGTPASARSDISAAAPAEAGVCADPTQPIADDMGGASDIVVGTTKVKTMQFDLYTYEHCRVTGAKVTVVAPRKTTRLNLRKVGTNNGYVHWQSSLKVSPTSLRNSDAGVWKANFLADGEHLDSISREVSVVRASRLTFNAGPEPVVNRRIIYSGKLERASWDSGRYVPHANRRIDSWADFAHQPEEDYLGEAVTRRDGTYRMSQRYRGPGDYHAQVGYSSTTAGVQSRTDRVTTP